MQDMLAKGRACIGDAHWSRQQPERVLRGEAVTGAKLTEAAVQEIKCAVARGESASSLAARFRVASRTIRDIKNGLTWRHVAPPTVVPGTDRGWVWVTP